MSNPDQVPDMSPEGTNEFKPAFSPEQSAPADSSVNLDKYTVYAPDGSVEFDPNTYQKPEDMSSEDWEKKIYEMSEYSGMAIEDAYKPKIDKYAAELEKRTKYDKNGKEVLVYTPEEARAKAFEMITKRETSIVENAQYQEWLEKNANPGDQESDGTEGPVDTPDDDIEPIDEDADSSTKPEDRKPAVRPNPARRPNPNVRRPVAPARPRQKPQGPESEASSQEELNARATEWFSSLTPVERLNLILSKAEIPQEYENSETAKAINTLRDKPESAAQENPEPAPEPYRMNGRRLDDIERSVDSEARRLIDAQRASEAVEGSELLSQGQKRSFGRAVIDAVRKMFRKKQPESAVAPEVVDSPSEPETIAEAEDTVGNVEQKPMTKAEKFNQMVDELLEANPEASPDQILAQIEPYQIPQSIEYLLEKGVSADAIVSRAEFLDGYGYGYKSNDLLDIMMDRVTDHKALIKKLSSGSIKEHILEFADKGVSVNIILDKLAPLDIVEKLDDLLEAGVSANDIVATLREDDNPRYSMIADNYEKLVDSGATNIDVDDLLDNRLSEQYLDSHNDIHQLLLQHRTITSQADAQNVQPEAA
jgi:hypothetical protein